MTGARESILKMEIARAQPPPWLMNDIMGEGGTMLVDKTIGDVFRNDISMIRVPMPKLFRTSLKGIAKKYDASVSQVASKILADYLIDLESGKRRFPYNAIGKYPFLMGKKKKVSLRMTKALQDALREHAKRLAVHKHEIIAVAIAINNGFKDGYGERNER